MLQRRPRVSNGCLELCGDFWCRYATLCAAALQAPSLADGASSALVVHAGANTGAAYAMVPFTPEQVLSTSSTAPVP